MNTLPSLTEDAIRARASQRSFVRGQEYFESSSVVEAVWRGDQLTVQVEGSEWTPYVVRVDFDGETIGSTDCTCPYDWGGDCKHIVAALLYLFRKPEMVEQRAPIADLLTQLDREQLVGILLDLVKVYPDIADRLENWATREARTEEASLRSPSGPPIDLNLLQRQIEADLQRSIQSGYNSWGEDSFYDSNLGIALEPALERAQTFLEAGDPHSALTILDAAAKAWDDGVYSLDPYVIETFEDIADEFTYPLAELWAEALLSADLSPDQRSYWIETLDEYVDSLYGGGSLELPLTAVQHGWDYPPLVAAMQGNITEKGAWEDEVPTYADFLAEIRLRVLDRRGQHQEYLNLAQAEGHFMAYLHMLIRQGETDKALDEAVQYLTKPRHIHDLVRTIEEHGPIERAFSLARHGLALESDDGKAALAEWLRDRAQKHQHPDLALWAAQRALNARVSLENYKALQKIAGSEWGELKPEAIRTVASSESPQVTAEVYIYEKMYAQAIEVVDNAEWFSNIDPVIRAVKAEHPEWAFRQCSKRADAIMDAGRAKDYAVAADWLRRGRDILLSAGLRDRWEAHLAALMETHERKYKLMPMLEKLRV